MRCRRWILQIGRLTALSMTATPGPQARSEFYSVRTGAYGPRTESRYARPTFRWEVWATDARAKVKEVWLAIDGKPVPATYDVHARAVTFTPNRPLAEGKHHVECRVTFDNDMRVDKNWDASISHEPLVELPPPTPSQREAVSAVNEIRRRLNLPPAQPDDRLNVAALGHSEYLSLHKATGHAEIPGTPGFVGATGGERVSVYGWTEGSWEDVSFGGRSPQESVADLFDAPYHRVPFLQVGAPLIGTGFVDQRLTLEFEQTSDTGTSISPPDGATGVPCSWHDFERPDPMRLYGAEGRITGYPIVIAHFAPGLPRLTKMFGWLSGPDKRDIPCWINTPANDDMLTCAAILIPKAPLRPNTEYHAGFDGQDATGATVREEIRFRTGSL